MAKRTKNENRKKIPQDVKIGILNTATKLFAERGFLGVSLREIMSAADVNIASAHYYFGSKEKLYIACELRFYNDVDEQRRERLALALVEPNLPVADRLERILSAYVIPHYALLTDSLGTDYVRLISRFQTEPPQLVRVILEKYFGPTRSLYVSALVDLFPKTDRDDILRVFSFFVDSMLHAPSDLGYEALTQTSTKLENPDRLAKLVVEFSVGGFLRVCEN